MAQNKKQVSSGFKQSQSSKVLLAVFAHPDDELLAGATLAHYAQKGVKVYIAIATDGALGTTDFSNIPAGKKLAAARQQEMLCSAKALGTEAPIFLALPDQLGAETGEVQKQLGLLRFKVDSLFKLLKPDVVITFGAEGWTGHPDHRLVGDIVTEVFASRSWPGKPAMYYPALPAGVINKKSWAFYLTVDSAYLTVRVKLDSSDYTRLRTAYQSHQSQYRESVRRKLPLFIESIQKGEAMFRPFSQTKVTKNSFF
jgi:LmbE family N-acetylglucosaminyl deacetylase